MDSVGPGFGKWQGGISSTAENLRACLHNAREAKERLQEAHDIALTKPGTVEGNAAKYRETKLAAEMLGWTQAASEWQRELDRLNRHAALEAATAQQQFALEEARRRAVSLSLSAAPPAEVVERLGADDDGDAAEPEPEPEERESAWADIGGAVGGR